MKFSLTLQLRSNETEEEQRFTRTLLDLAGCLHLLTLLLLWLCVCGTRVR